MTSRRRGVDTPTRAVTVPGRLMKPWRLLSVLILCSNPAWADELQTPHVTAFGTAVTEVVPDKMIWSLRVETRGQSLENVADKHSQTVQTVLDFLKKEGIEEKAMQTSRMELGENWEYQANSRIRNGYIASTEISFKLTDLNAYERLWKGLAKIPSVSVQGVSYDHTKRIQYQNETRQKAILAARDKADSMARVLGAEVGDPLLIEDDSPG